jgi:excisionase family DNA binding protein
MKRLGSGSLGSVKQEKQLSAVEAARRLNVHVCTVRRWLLKGLLRGQVVRREWRVAESAVREFQRVVSVPD